MASVWGELKRRNVVRVAIAYVIVAWLILQIGDTLGPALRLPDEVNTALAFFLILGFPLAVFLAWAFELTPEGLKKEKDVDRSQSITRITGRKIDYLVIAALVLALGFFAFDKFALGPSRQAAEPATVKTVDKSIAVLAFADLSPEGDQEYFSDGISEELLNVLAKLPGLQVAARTSSFQFKGENRDVIDIGKQLNVAMVLEGSVRKAGLQLRITAQLVDARSGFHLWSETYDRELANVFAVQDEISAAIVEALKEHLGLQVATVPRVIAAANTDAYEAYLRGRELIHLRGEENLEEAVSYLERALRLDNNFAPAHAQLAIATSLLVDHPGGHGALSLEEVRRKAIPHLERALELKPNLAEAHGGLALLARYSGDPTSAIEYARRAVELNPSYSDAMNFLYIALGDLGRYEEREATIKQALDTDPLNIILRLNYANELANRHEIERSHELADQLLAQSLRGGYQSHAQTAIFNEGKLAEGLLWALREAAETSSMWSDRLFTVLVLVGEYDEARRLDETQSHWVDVAEGRFDKAIKATQRKMLLDPENQGVINDAAFVLYVAGRIDEALPLYEQLRNFVPEERPIGSSNFSMMRLALARRKTGDEEGAQAAARIARQDHAASGAAGAKNQYQDGVEAMFAAFENDPNRVISTLSSAMQLGLRNPQFFNDLIFEDMWGDPRFVALQEELDTILTAEHDKVLQLICFNNPVPGHWQPLPETCEGVDEQLVL